MKVNNPDKLREKKTCKLISLKIIPVDKNVSIAEFEKLSKYKDLEIEVEKLWHMKTDNPYRDWGLRYD